MKKITHLLIGLTLLILHFLFFTPKALAIVDPLAVPNNKFGIHIISATPSESSPAAALVNSNGDWGYVTFLIESKDRDHNKWQQFFDDLRRRHLIPLVRLATQPEGNPSTSSGQVFWKRPYEGEEQAWADFLDSLNWPTKNRYVIIYNEPNHAKEWGNKVDAQDYAKVLDQTITALKNKNRDFFVLNAGFDASAPSKPPMFEDQLIFMKKMNEAVPGIFDKLDGWVCHCYPNPGFVGSPDGMGRGTVKTYLWEMEVLRSLGLRKNLPIFITETGWRHAEGLTYDPSLPNSDTVADYYQLAFENAWVDFGIVAITPFLLNYQDSPFDRFSFKKPTGEKQNDKILGVQYPEYYSFYQTIQALPKTVGRPIQENKAELVKGEIYSSIVAGETYTVFLTFKNSGQSIWNDRSIVKLEAFEGGKDLGLESVEIPTEQKIEPGQQHTFALNLKAPLGGIYNISVNLFQGSEAFDSPPIRFTTKVKSPVILKILGSLGWKKDFSGQYFLTVKGAGREHTQSIGLNSAGISSEIEARYLLPDYTFEFSLEKPFYYPKSLQQKVYAGVNTLYFDTLQPDLPAALFHPKELWQLLPFVK